MSDAGAACPLCARIVEREIVEEVDLAAATADAFPLSPGHTLVVPKRHVADWFGLTRDEQCAILALAGRVHDRLAATHAPDGWNLGVNVGEAGGQTIGHVHLHVIPRYRGDRDDPRGGVRWILPKRAPYWER